ncbi:MAG: KpsF/GutQ family sugar-phosphate isomerase [Bacteroidetes bacterium]|nr:MAG: KpsF/GutQ family sugar-phosphate isomerase [Bacteroidota bacterium]
MEKKEKLIRRTALQTLRIEAAAIRALESSIDGTFCRVVAHLFAASGRLVVTGIGKSALIAQKIAATLNSTGTPALFMHAADAIHGDLGMIQPADTVLVLSKSGRTPEIRVLVPLVKNLGNFLVAMVADGESFLARQADAVLLTPVEQEADPNNLAPTASTAAQMALGDALATALLALRGFTPQDFAQFHPGGSLGKQLYLRVRDIYPHNERPAVQPHTPLKDTILEMTSRRLGCAVVLHPDERVAGIITDGDLRRMLEAHGNPDLERLTAADIMTPHPKTIAPDALAVKALQIMRQNSITQVVVEDGGRYLGIVHLHDLIREGLL